MSGTARRADLLTQDGLVLAGGDGMSERGFSRLLRACAMVVADGPGDPAAIHDHLAALLDPPHTQRFLRPLAGRLATLFAGHRPRWTEVRSFLGVDRPFHAAWRRHGLRAAGLAPAAVWRPHPGPPSAWKVPPWTTAAAVADALGCPVADLGWLAGGHPSRPLPAGQRHHYRYRWVAKARGGCRLIEEPKGWLKAMQRRLLRQHLDHIPVHDHAHGFVRGRGIRGFAAPHAGKAVVVRLDLADFFASVRGTRIIGLFMAAGHPERVARMLAGICCNRVPAAVLASRSDGRQTGGIAAALGDWHLPQGAPTSPALANAIAYRLDCRLAGLAAAGADYTRYADDLVFSGAREFAVGLEVFLIRANAIIIDEGFRVQAKKTRIMRASARQQVGGLVVNRQPACPRALRDALKAILYNCVKHGPTAQNREGVNDFRAHLAGRISWVTAHRPEQGRKLQDLFARIVWDDRR